MLNFVLSLLVYLITPFIIIMLLIVGKIKKEKTMYQVEVKVSFRAGHRLMHPYKGKCNNVHGEYFTAIFILEQKRLDNCGMLIDFGVVKNQIKSWIDANLDHAYIHNSNDEIGKLLMKEGFKVFSMWDQNPTAENLACMLYELAKSEWQLPVIKVGVVESTETSIAWYKKG